MRIDRTHRPWLTATIVLLCVATLAYIPYALASQTGPSGGSALGLIYGISGYGMMLFAGLLGARKKVPVWRIGRAQTWMRGHLWLGALSFPLILFHAGFAWRGQLTAVLMLLFVIVWVSGLVGAAIQHYLPHMMTSRVPLETIYEEIPHVRQQLREEADQLAASICGPLSGQAADPEEPSGESAAVAVTTLVEIEPEDRVRFRGIYLDTVRPYLENPDTVRGEFTAVFESLRRMLPSPIHSILEDLEGICEEERQLNRQRKLYHLLHGWLLVHVPLSIALLVLGGIHALVAVQY
jgi:hypothetical protein